MSEKKIRRQYGLWDSPVSAGSLAAGKRLGEVQWGGRNGRDLFWLEGRSAQGVVVSLAEGDVAPRDITGEHHVRAQVGYGGGDFIASRHEVFFVDQSSGRIFKTTPGTGNPRPLTPPHGKASLGALSPDGAWLVYVHHDEQEIDRLAIVDTAGKGWPAILAAGHDFYMQPVWSPDGRHLAWVSWDHPQMPWDGARLLMAPVVERERGLPELGEVQFIAGGKDVAVFQPEFDASGEKLYFISDKTGWGQLWSYELSSEKKTQITTEKAEFGIPAWIQGMRTYALSPDGNFATCVRSRKGFHELCRIDLESQELEEVEGLDRYGDISQITSSDRADAVAFIASGPHTSPRVVLRDFEHAETRVIARSLGETLDARDLARPEALSWKTGDGETAHGLFYPPASRHFESTGRPPLIVFIHGGPTSQATAGWSSQAQYFATRGYAALYVNYRGSTGYGRDYMLRLRGDWGICDVEDAVSGMEFLAESDRIDRDKTVILGGSAGGFTVLQSLVTRPEAFTAGVCLYGVSNQFTLASDTHKFEAHYLDSLLGTLPEAADLYRERSPVFHAEKIRRPLAIFQGEEDQVVPRDQSDSIAATLERTGVPHVYQVYEGEGHGWRKRETIDHFYRAVESFLKEHVIFR